MIILIVPVGGVETSVGDDLMLGGHRPSRPDSSIELCIISHIAIFSETSHQITVKQMIERWTEGVSLNIISFIFKAQTRIPYSFFTSTTFLSRILKSAPVITIINQDEKAIYLKLTESNMVLDVLSLFLWVRVVPSGIGQFRFYEQKSDTGFFPLVDLVCLRTLTIKLDAVVRRISLPWAVSSVVSLRQELLVDRATLVLGYRFQTDTILTYEGGNCGCQNTVDRMCGGTQELRGNSRRRCLQPPHTRPSRQWCGQRP